MRPIATPKHASQHRSRIHLTAVAALTFVLLGSAPTALAAAATPTPAPSPGDSAHPIVMQQAQAGALAGPALKAPASIAAPAVISGAPIKEVFGFAFGNSGLGDPTVGYPSWQMNLLTTIAYFGLDIGSDGAIIRSGPGWATWNSAPFVGMQNAAAQTGTRIIVSLDMHDFGSDPNRLICIGLEPANQQTTVSQVVAEVNHSHVQGVNFDYEGLNNPCSNGARVRDEMTNLVKLMRAALPSAYIAVDTYASSANDPGGFFDVPGLAAYADSLFVMAYDSEYSNYAHPPLACSRFCLGPTGPLGGYYYNDDVDMTHYTAVVPASKVILGVPYYGRKACVSDGSTPNAYPIGSVTADSYLNAAGEASDPAVRAGSFTTNRDANDPSGHERWDTWYNTTLACWRELYWDDVTSLGSKYDLVNAYGLRGVGLFALQYGGGAPELWSSLASHFAAPLVTTTPPANPATTRFSVGLSAAWPGRVSSFDVISYDVTAGTGWYDIATGIAAQPAGSGNWSGSVTVYGYPGHRYEYLARAWTYQGVVSRWSSGADSTVAAGAAYPLPFKGLYNLRPDGFLQPDLSPPVGTWQLWPGQDLARAAHPLPVAGSPQLGAVVNAYGALLSYGQHLTLGNSAYWPGQDVARDFAFLPDGSGGYVLDMSGNLWPFSVNGAALPPAVHGNPTWPGLDIARKVAILPDGSGGYVLDYTGAVNPFAIGSHAVPPAPHLSQHWPDQDFARDMVLLPGSRSGYVLNGWGGLAPFSAPGDPLPAVPAGYPYWPGHDIAKGLFLLPGSTSAAPGGYILDCAGGLSQWGNAPSLGLSGTWSCGTAKGLSGG